MFRELHGSKLAGDNGPSNGNPSRTISEVCFQPPIWALRSRNSSGVIVPLRSATSPYCTPTLSHGTRAHPFWSAP
jgi:hypothetical protein